MFSDGGEEDSVWSRNSIRIQPTIISMLNFHILYNNIIFDIPKFSGSFLMYG